MYQAISANIRHLFLQITGKLVEGIEEDVPSTEPTLTKKQALRLAIEEEGDDPAAVSFDENEDIELVIYKVTSKFPSVRDE